MIHGAYLYGTTRMGGDASGAGGTIFRVKRTGVGYELLYTFQQTDGEFPTGPLFLKKGALYGTMTAGGNGPCPYFGCGVVFKFVP